MAAAELSAICNYLALSPTLGTAGQPTAEQFEAIAQADYAVVVNLALSTSDRAILHEAELVKTFISLWCGKRRPLRIWPSFLR